jgi:restriction system protein
MKLRTAKQGKNAGTQFWGCTGYPECKGAVPLEEK